MPFEEVFRSSEKRQHNIGTAVKNESLPKKVHPVAGSDLRKLYANEHVQNSNSSDSTLIDDDRSVEGPPKALKTVLKFSLPKSRKEQRLFSKKSDVNNSKDHWKLEEYGGVKIWVNSKTGEVSVENPESDDDEDDELCSHTSSKHCGPFLVHREGGIPNGPKSSKVADNKSNKRPSKKSFSLLRILGLSKKEEQYHSNDVKEWFDMLDSGRTSRTSDRVMTSQKRHHGQQLKVKI
eukprot:gene2671-2837_t